MHAECAARVHWRFPCENGAVNAESLPRALEGIVGSDFSDPTNERIIYLSALGLAVVGLALLTGTILWWRRGRQEHPVLAPLEVTVDVGSITYARPVPRRVRSRWNGRNPSTCKRSFAACPKRSTTCANPAPSRSSQTRAPPLQLMPKVKRPSNLLSRSGRSKPTRPKRRSQPTTQRKSRSLRPTRRRWRSRDRHCSLSHRSRRRRHQSRPQRLRSKCSRLGQTTHWSSYPSHAPFREGCAYYRVRTWLMV